MNDNKSFFLSGPKTGNYRINRLRECTSFMDKKFSFNYLGCPIYIGRKKICYFDSLVTKVIKRLSSWQGKLLYNGGKMILLRSVVQSFTSYILSAICPPKATIELLEIHFVKFLWGSIND